MASLCEHAIALAGQGYRVFPLIPEGKTPAIKGWQKKATTDLAAVRKMWGKRPYNIGIATGNGLAVLDLDTKDSTTIDEKIALLGLLYDDIPETPTVETPSGGRHYYFRTDAAIRNSVGRLARGVDVRGEDGYVVAPPSRLEAGSYAGRQNASFEELTALPRGFLETASGESILQKREQDKSVVLRQLDVVDDILASYKATEYLMSAEPAIEGAGGDAHTYAVAARVLDFGVSGQDALDLMLDYWNDRCSPPWQPGDLKAKIRNARDYRQNPLGNRAPVKAEAEFGPVKVVDRRTNQPHNPQNVVTFTRKRNHGYVIKGLLNFGMTGVITGLPNAGKTPLALDMGAHVAKGEPWRGMRVKQGYVLCLATEGWTGFENRMEAIRAAHFAGDTRDAPFEFETRRVDLVSSPRHSEEIAEMVNRRAAMFGLQPGVIILDTLSHTLAGGDDSDQTVMRPALASIARIISATGAAVLATHHPTKTGSSDTRGSSILTFDTDLLIKVEADPKRKVSKVTTPRTKDYGQIDPLYFRNRVVEIGKDADGDPITTVIAEWQALAEEEFVDRLPERQQQILDVLLSMEKETSQTKRTFTAWFEACNRANEGMARVEVARSTFKHAKLQLEKSGHIGKDEEDQYFTR